jgi:hypothetical protein
MNHIPIQVGGRDVPDARDRIRRYCGLTWSGGSPETGAYRYFDLVPSESPDEVTPVDVLAAAALHPGLSRTDLAFFVDRADDLSDWLRSIPVDAELRSADSDFLAHLDALVDFDGVSITLLSKVLHRKRPSLIPLLDRHIIDWYRPVTGERSATLAWAPIIRAMQQDLVGDVNGSLTRIADALRPELTSPPPAVRLIDIAIWMGSQR